KVELENRDTTIDVMGNGALPDSQGLRKIQAKRAAEVDAYRKLAERLLGVQITSSTTVKDFVLKSDKILARTAQIIKGAKTMAIIYGNDDSCEVKMQIKVADIYDVIERYSGKGKDTVSVERKQETTTFTETGRGAPRPVQEQAAQAGMPTSEADAMDGAYRETSIVIKKLVGQGIVVD
ncbi:MAG: hypothetical protein O3B24_09545, partial [Verrucomicrobia bacterium]|nr:hypothetical protein [Verrucomicrobiota bacterium]